MSRIAFKGVHENATVSISQPCVMWPFRDRFTIGFMTTINESRYFSEDKKRKQTEHDPDFLKGFLKQFSLIQPISDWNKDVT